MGVLSHGEFLLVFYAVSNWLCYCSSKYQRQLRASRNYLSWSAETLTRTHTGAGTPTARSNEAAADKLAVPTITRKYNQRAVVLALLGSPPYQVNFLLDLFGVQPLSGFLPELTAHPLEAAPASLNSYVFARCQYVHPWQFSSVWWCDGRLIACLKSVTAGLDTEYIEGGS